MNIIDKIEEIKNEYKLYAEDKKIYIAFSGGLDSTVAALIARDTFDNSKITLINVCFGAYSYSKGLEAVLILANQMNLRLFFTQGEKEQENLMYHGPNCNQCTKNIKLGKVKEFVYKGLVVVGSNQSDSWGKLGIKYNDGIYSPLLNLNKKEINEILNFYGFKIPKIGESNFREGCKFKHLLKMAVNNKFHSRADVIANEVLHDILDFYNYERTLGNVKIIGPLSKNIALINVKPIPENSIKKIIIEKISQEETIDEVVFVDKPLKLKVAANPGIINNENSKYWIENGRLAPEFAMPIEVDWNTKSNNNKLWTFSVVDYQFL